MSTDNIFHVCYFTPPSNICSKVFIDNHSVRLTQFNLCMICNNVFFSVMIHKHLNKSKTSSFFIKINKFERQTQIATKFINVQ